MEAWSISPTNKCMYHIVRILFFFSFYACLLILNSFRILTLSWLVYYFENVSSVSFIFELSSADSFNFIFLYILVFLLLPVSVAYCTKKIWRVINRRVIMPFFGTCWTLSLRGTILVYWNKSWDDCYFGLVKNLFRLRKKGCRKWKQSLAQGWWVVRLVRPVLQKPRIIQPSSSAHFRCHSKSYCHAFLWFKESRNSR